MKLFVDTSGVQFMVGRETQPKNDQHGVQRTERSSNLPMWSVQLVAMDDGGAEVITVTVAAAEPPKVTVNALVTPVALQAIPWAQNGKNGVAFRASELKPVKATSAQTS